MLSLFFSFSFIHAFSRVLTHILLLYLPRLYISFFFPIGALITSFRIIFDLSPNWQPRSNRSINNTARTLKSIKLLCGARSCCVVCFSYLYAYVAFIIVITTDRVIICKKNISFSREQNNLKFLSYSKENLKLTFYYIDKIKIVAIHNSIIFFSRQEDIMKCSGLSAYYKALG